MEKPSNEEREALRLYLSSMDEPTRTVNEAIRESIRSFNAKLPSQLTPVERRRLIAQFRSLQQVPTNLPSQIPRLAIDSRARWHRWRNTAIAGAKSLERALRTNDRQAAAAGFDLINSLPDLRNDIVSPEMEMWALTDEVLEDPITDDEYEHMLRVRKSNDYPRRPSPEWDDWSVLTCRYLYQFPFNLEHEMWHEAAHIVVGHRLGWTVQCIDRRPAPDHTPIAIVPPPCEPPELRVLDYSTVAVAGYLSEDKAFGKAMPSTDHINVAHQFKAAEVRVGKSPTSETTLTHVLEAEVRAQAILNDHWRAVQRIAELALQELPVRRDALLRELHDVPQDRPNCGPRGARTSPVRQRSLITTAGFQAGNPNTKR